MKKQDKKIIEEILSIAPELGSNKQALGVAVEMLKKMDPKIQADPSFKSHLKQRLEALTNFQTPETKMKKVFTFLVPVMSLGFVAFGLFVFFENTGQPIESQRVSEDTQVASQSKMIDDNQQEQAEDDIDMLFDAMESQVIQEEEEKVVQEKIAPKKASRAVPEPSNQKQEAPDEVVEEVQAEIMTMFQDESLHEENSDMAEEESISDDEVNEIMNDIMPMGAGMMMDALVEAEVTDWDKEIQKLLEQGCQEIQIDIDGNTCAREDGEYRVCTEMLSTQKLELPICVDEEETEKK